MTTKILMVCLGNICRSPLAEGILQSKLPKDKFIVDSAGTSAWHVGQHPDERAIAIAKKKGIDISTLIGRQFNSVDFLEFDHIYVMDRENYHAVTQLAPNEKAKKKVKMILDELFIDENRNVPDPYFGKEDGFETVYTMLDEACEVITKKLIEKKDTL